MAQLYRFFRADRFWSWIDWPGRESAGRTDSSAAPGRRRLLGLWPLAAGLLLATLGGQVLIGETGMAKIAAALRDPAALFDLRSPGERTAGSTYSIKSRAKHAASPRERVLPGLREASSPFPLIELPDPTPAILGDMPLFDEVMPTALAAMPVSGPAGPAGTPFASLPAGPLSPGGGILPPGPGPGPTPDPQPLPIPEPATWAAILLGLCVVGAMMRVAGRRRMARQ